MKNARKAVATDAEIDAAIERGRKYDKQATKIVRAEYSRKHDHIRVVLSTGATFSVPRRRLPGLSTYQPNELGPVQVEPPGYALWFDRPDVGVRIESLLRAVVGEELMRSIAAQQMGAARSDKKSAAARKNGVAGGRPPKRRAGLQAVKKSGLDAHSRDTDGRIRQKGRDMRIGTLRETYGENFAAGYRSDMKLDTLLNRTGSSSLKEYLKK